MRRYYNKGTCKQLKDDLHFCFIFMDDDESYWTPTEINKIWFDRIEEAVYFIKLNASYYKVNLDISRSFYSSCDENSYVHYKGKVNPDIFSHNIERDILDQAAFSLGFKSKKEMHTHIKKKTNREQIAYVVMFNKKGVSYAMNHNQGDENYIEYCVVFNGYLDTNKDCASGTIVHEIFHLFGAEDYYDPYKNYPKRKDIATKIFPTDIMLKIYRNIYLNTVGQYTAYTLGWTDDCPKACDCKDWWR